MRTTTVLVATLVLLSGGLARGGEEPGRKVAEYPQFTGGKSVRGVTMAVIDRTRSLTIDLNGKDATVSGDERGVVIALDGRRVWMSHDAVADFSNTGGAASPRALLEKHMTWRFEAEWGELLRVADLSRRTRAGEKIETGSKLTTFTPTNVAVSAGPKDAVVLGWEVPLQKATGTVKSDGAVAVVLYRTIKVDSAVAVFMTEVKTGELAKVDEVRRALDANVKTAALHDGPLDFPRYAQEKGLRPLQDDSSEGNGPTPEMAQSICEKGERRACTDLGIRYFFGRGGVAKDFEKAKSYLSRACEQDDPPGCFGLAGMYMNGMGVDLDLAKGATLLDKACKLGFEAGCRMRQQLADDAKPKADGAKTKN